MMRKITLISAFLAFSLLGFSQKLKCEDFHIGNFTMTCDQFPESTILIFRDEKEQTETEMLSDSIAIKDNSKTIYEFVEWVSDCKYKLTFNASKGSESDSMKYLNSIGGVIVNIVKIEENCYLYESYIIINGQKKDKLSGQICKIIDFQ